MRGRPGPEKGSKHVRKDDIIVITDGKPVLPEWGIKSMAWWLCSIKDEVAAWAAEHPDEVKKWEEKLKRMEAEKAAKAAKQEVS